ncbi:hypothetical protein AAFF_G00004810 [Aldrovandia affinis]|uniref:Uncharacterized protein n=1 Tax=Aldrovandia affinis TaxID=143900 RepID=A0AAD7TDK2_9TELE|nr:hypothetical protein AAFF_G00004810 [Aldrovandia affinis]
MFATASRESWEYRVALWAGVTPLFLAAAVDLCSRHPGVLRTEQHDIPPSIPLSQASDRPTSCLFSREVCPVVVSQRNRENGPTSVESTGSFEVLKNNRVSDSTVIISIATTSSYSISPLDPLIHCEKPSFSPA